MGITAIECIERQLASAVRMFFDGYSDVAVLTLVAINAHSIEKYAARKSVKLSEPFFYEYTRQQSTFDEQRIKKLLSTFRALLVHAESPLWDEEVDIDEQKPELLLFAVCYDLDLLSRAIERKLVREVEAFLLWFQAKHFSTHEGVEIYVSEYRTFESLAGVSPLQQLRRGKMFLNWWTTRQS